MVECEVKIVGWSRKFRGEIISGLKFVEVRSMGSIRILLRIWLQVVIQLSRLGSLLEFSYGCWWLKLLRCSSKLLWKLEIFVLKVLVFGWQLGVSFRLVRVSGSENKLWSDIGLLLGRCRVEWIEFRLSLNWKRKNSSAQLVIGELKGERKNCELYCVYILSKSSVMLSPCFHFYFICLFHEFLFQIGYWFKTSVMHLQVGRSRRFGSMMPVQFKRVWREF